MGLRTWLRNNIQRTRVGRRAYDAARWNRFTTDFLAPNTSADAEIRGSLKVLRNRSRALVRDNPYARQAKRTTQINVIGARGIQMQPQILRPNGTEKDERRNAALSEAWKRCAAPTPATSPAASASTASRWPSPAPSPNPAKSASA